MMNPFLLVSDSDGIKGGAADSPSPSLSRIKNKFSTQRQFAMFQKIRDARSCKYLAERFSKHFWTIVSRFSAGKGVYGHITLNTSVLVRSLKLSKVETC